MRPNFQLLLPGKVQPYYQGFVLYFVIGCREVQTNHAFDLISFWAVEYHTTSTCLPIRGFVCVNAPLWDLFCPWPSTRVNSAIKSTTTCPFMAVRGRYCISNSLNSTVHNAIRLATSGLLIALHRGLSVKTTIVCA